MQLTQPTSKTAMLVRRRRAILEQLSCFICKGYLIDATTIDECMDSFCRSCIINYLRVNNNCPKCTTIIHSTNPLGSIRSDKVLQDIVYKLVPGLYDNEMKRRREFYRGIYGTSSSSSDDSDGDRSGSSSLSSIIGIAGKNFSLSSEQYGIVPRPKPFYKPTDSIDLSIEIQTRADSSTIYYDNKQQSIVTSFTGNLQNQPFDSLRFTKVDSQQFKTYLRCPAKFTALQLKKFIAAKFNTCKDDTIHLFYLNESLKSEYSLIDIAYIYDWRGIEHMRLFYIIERDLSRMDDIRSIDTYPISRREKTRQSVGTSTQAVKRVCIDPHPQYYEEQDDNNNNDNSNISDAPAVHPSGRRMRSRPVEQPKMIIATQAQAPILRSYSSSRETQTCASNHISKSSASSRQTSNGISKRELASLEDYETVSKNVNAVRSYPNDYTNSKQSKSVAIANVAGPSQGSLVTLASFTEARSNSVVTMSSSSAAITSSYKNLLETSNQTGRSDNQGTYNQVATRANQQSTPQLAFRFVTERGITIVRRVNNNSEGSTSASAAITNSSSITANRTPAFPSITAPQSNSSNDHFNNSTRFNDTTRYVTASTHRPSTTSSGGRLVGASVNYIGFNRPNNSTSTSSSSSSSLSNNETNSSRHQAKVKPVYKTFVDPTKIKTPNFKRLSYAARH